ncbi:uncharacterized protein LOC131007314 [Salvia miltiorrhiza]|uniref:uncharacterized protein LOC131007314 n=1 Tax=Salvia miltiorrhiza TaxID=226208 RepID=UPI0025AC1C09|nr:uncharacterized protein LOC131007314 [Salvia miltiorrhiza]
MACKIDIKKAFETLCWDFLLNVLRVVRYSDRFINWIDIILRSARLSILYNGQLYGCFACSRGVRQGDSLSPILFGIAEDALSKLFHNCVGSGHLAPMPLQRGVSFPTHLLYVDDILVFCIASVSNAETLHRIFEYYGLISGHIVSKEKSQVLFFDRVPPHTRRLIARCLDFSKGTFPFIYLGVPIFRGKVWAYHLRAIHDRILDKFSRWKGLHLSMAGRICLVKIVIQSSITHSMMIYCWPRSLLKELDSKCRNFIWKGDVNKKPTCSVSWARLCAIKEEGGLGIRSFTLMNKCFLMKLAWRVTDGQSFGFDIIHARYLTRCCKVRSQALTSMIWLGLRQEVAGLVHDSYSYIGDSASTRFWTDDWLGYRLVDKCDIPYFM